ncbi:MAG: protein kinase [Anaerolineales bacterium]|nr:protein kinase [Anaerolineales bacterium]
MSLESGTLLGGRYRIERVLGQGGMGAVYLAIDENLGTSVAVKENLNASPESERQFKREATLLATLRHSNLPRVTDHFVLSGQQYLVMDFVEGEDLRERLASGGAVPLDDVIRWSAQICDALTYLHARTPPVIHRDIKPGNIRLAPGDQAILVDFGIAKASGGDSKTTTAAIALTPGYAPPEQYGMGRTDGRSDLYALAATLYATLTGRTPPDSMERLLNNAELPRPEVFCPGLPQHVSDALMRGLALKPAERFADARTFKLALQGQIPSEPVATSAQDATVVAGFGLAGEPTVVAKEPTTGSRGGLSRGTSPSDISATVVAPEPAPSGTGPRPAAAARPMWLIPAGIGAVALAGLGVAALVFALTRGGADDPAAPTATPQNVAFGETAMPSPEITVERPAATATSAPTPEPTETRVPPTVAPTAAASPTVSAAATGPRIAFISNRDGQYYQVYTMAADGSDVRQVTTDPSNKWSPDWQLGRLGDLPGTQLAWSPDGQRIVYTAEVSPGGPVDLWIVNADGTNPVNLTVPDRAGRPNEDDFQPVWCDGKTIFFTSIRNQYPQIFVIEADNRAPRNYSTTRSNVVEYNPTFFRSDCRRMLVISTQNGRGELWRVFPFPEVMQAMWDRFPLSGQFSYRVFLSELPQNNIIVDADVSPDGLFVAYTRQSPSALGNNIMLTTVEDSPLKMSFTQLTDGHSDSSPRWSPDGKQIVFVSRRDGGGSQIYVMTSLGENEVNLSGIAEWDELSPVWGPAP